MKKMKYLCLVVSMFIVTALIATQLHAYNEEICGYENSVWSTPFEWLDHTYACVGNESNCYTSPASATTSGGDLAECGVGDGDLAECLAFCQLTYGVNGVCHQHTNRVMYPTGKTLPSSIRGYTLSVFYWGTHGMAGPSSGRFDTCLNSCT